MAPPLRSYGAKKNLSRSTSESAVNALFAKNIFERNHKKSYAIRKKKPVEVKDLPPIVPNEHKLLNDTNTSFHVHGIDETFEKLKKRTTFDRVLRSNPEKQQETKETEAEATIADANEDTDDEMSESIIDFSQDLDFQEIIHKSLTPSKSTDNAHIVHLGESILCYTNLFDDSSPMNVSGSAKRKSSHEKCEALALDSTADLSLDISISKIQKNTNNLGKFVVCSTPITKNHKLKRQEVLTPIKIHNTASNNLLEQSVRQIYEWSYKAPDLTAYDIIRRSRAKRLALNNYTSDCSGSSSMVSMKYANNSVDNRRKSENIHVSSKVFVSVPRLPDADLFKIMSRQCERYRNPNGECSDFSIDASEFQLPDESMPLVKTNQMSNVNIKRTKYNNVDAPQFEEFYSLIKDSIVLDVTNENTNMSKVENVVVRRTTRSKNNSNGAVTRSQASLLANENDDESMESLNNKSRFVNKRRPYPRKAKLHMAYDYHEATTTEIDENTMDTFNETAASQATDHLIESPDLFDSDELLDMKLNEIEPEIKDEECVKLEESNVFVTPISEVQAAESVDKVCSDVINVDEDEENDKVGETLPVCNIQKRNEFGHRVPLPAGKTWRRSLASYKRNTMLHEVLEGQICTCNDCKDTNLNEITVGRKSRFSITIRQTASRYSQLQKTVSNRQTGYERDRRRETDALEKLIEDISLNVSQLIVSQSNPTARELVLRRCRQDKPEDFSKCYTEQCVSNCRKIGEGVYGEVFLFRNISGKPTVMKIIPIEGEMLVNGEKQKKFEEIISEIIIASELSNLRTNTVNSTSAFNEVHRIKCVKGKYPEHLAELWDIYNEDKGSENDSPEIFDDGQLYIVLELAFAGTDLESFVFGNFCEVYHVFLQVALSLAVAEEELQFEHRDLHWGNILVTKVAKHDKCLFNIGGEDVIMQTHGVLGTIIDFTLSRITYDDICIYNDLSQDPDLFNADGDYQFDIYRGMQKDNGNNWETFSPYSNVLWLHYLLHKMTTSIRFVKKKIAVRDKVFISELQEWEESLLSFKSAKQFVTEIILPKLDIVKKNSKICKL